MKSWLLLGFIIGCVVVVTSGCNYNKEMCRAQYEEGKAKGDCYEDLSSGFGDKFIKACADVCHPLTGDEVKCEDFCPGFNAESEGVCSTETSTVTTTTGIPPTTPKGEATLPIWVYVVIAVLGTVVVILLVAVVYLLWERRKGNKEFVKKKDLESFGFSTPRQQFGSRVTFPGASPSKHPSRYFNSIRNSDSALPTSASGTLQRSTPCLSSNISQAETSLSAQSAPFLPQPTPPETVD